MNDEQNALWILKRLKEEFPGLWDDDHDSEISGADLIGWLANQIQETEILK